MSVTESAPTTPVDPSVIEGEDGIDVVASTAWLAGSTLFAAATAWVVVALFEWLVYDFRVFGPTWSLSALAAGGFGWLTMMTVGVARLRIDSEGVHLRTLRRNRDFAWGSVQVLGVTNPRLPLAEGVLTVVADLKSHVTPLSLNTHEVGAAGMLERVTPLAQNNDVAIVDRDVPVQ